MLDGAGYLRRFYDLHFDHFERTAGSERRQKCGRGKLSFEMKDERSWPWKVVIRDEG